MAHLAVTATALVALAFQAPLWAADFLITSCLDDDHLTMPEAGDRSSTVTAYTLLVVLLSGAAVFFVAVLRLHLALSPLQGLAAARKGTVATVTTAALVAISALGMLCLCVVLLQF